MTPDPVPDPELRRRAEARLPDPAPSEVEAQRLLHELEVHRIELELQNEELQHTRAEVEASLARYTDIYDFAPCGYFTLDTNGRIVQANLAGARLLGLERVRLQGRSLGHFLADTHRPAFTAFLEQVFADQHSEGLEANLAAQGRTVHIAATLSSHGQECLAVVADISDRKRLEQVQVFLAKAEWLAAGEDFFPALARFLAEHLGMDYVCIDRLAGDALSAETLAIRFDGAFQENVTYTLKETPCGDVVGKTVCCFPHSVRQLFPCDEVLQDMGAEAYLGTTLWSSAGQPIGLIALISRKPLDATAHAESVLGLVAVRAAGELERREIEAARRLSESRLAEAFDASPIGMALVALDGRFVRLNPCFCAMLGREEAGLVGLTFADITHPDDRAQSHHGMKALLGGDVQEFRMEKRHVHRLGHAVWVQVHVSLVRDGQGKPLHFVTQVVDITERRRTEQALQESEARHAMALAALQDGLWDWDVASGEAYFSPGYYALLGYEDGEFPACYASWRILVHPDDLDLVELDLRRGIEEGAGFAIDLRMKTKAGDWRWVSTRGRAVAREGEGKALRMVGTLTDITERKRAEKELRGQHAMLARTEHIAHVGSWEWDRATDRVLWSEELFRIFQLDPAKGAPSFAEQADLYLPEDMDRLRQAVERCLADGTPYELELKARLADGGILHCVARGEGEADEEGRIQRLVGSLQDITERKRAEQERRSLSDQLNHLQRMESIGRLAGGVAHDMNNVLASIMAVATLIRYKGGENLEEAELVLRASQRGRDLVKNLMDFARKEVEEADQVDVNELVRREAVLLSSTMMQRIKVVIDLAPGQPLVLGSGTALSTSLMNLCVNAADAMPAGGILTLRTRLLDDRTLELAVEDTGEGMSPEVLARAQEPFYTTKEMGKGTGLGLSVVFGTVQAHQGTLDIHSRPGAGTQVLIRLPILPGTERLPAMVSPPVRKMPPLRILMVDDDPMVRQTARAMLEGIGHRVTLAAGGREALGLLEQGGAWDVVLLDHNMPDMDGAETLRRLREIRTELPVITASGYLDDQMRARILEMGRVAVLSKPYSIEEVQNTLAELIERGWIPSSS